MRLDGIEYQLRRTQDVLLDIRGYVRTTLRLQAVLLCFWVVMAFLCLVQMARLYDAVQEMDRGLHGRFDRIEQEMDALPMQLRAIADDIRAGTP